MKVRFKKHIREAAEKIIYERGYHEGHINISFFEQQYNPDILTDAENFSEIRHASYPITMVIASEIEVEDNPGSTVCTSIYPFKNIDIHKEHVEIIRDKEEYWRWGNNVWGEHLVSNGTSGVDGASGISGIDGKSIPEEENKMWDKKLDNVFDE